ncbi:hypothetical protein FW774_02695 (plasmid) [Pedobacter sp. BS3]|uniref:sensor histidine kinase n=1 Tax=Pedobacter sp. BS3 TaxID=2567937 RepID=UPI0011EE39F6|nr:sensor histidine kinase [Pedobacter sp. BS3]TZF85989.1 hypothetical protein FW774_02695 [Pedobacter sp. BS3]
MRYFDSMLNSRRLHLFMHLIGWVLFLSLPFIFSHGYQHTNWQQQLPNYLLFSAIFIAIYYFNTQILIPRFFFGKRYVAYGLCIMALLLLIAVIKPYERFTMNIRQHDWSEMKSPQMPMHHPADRGAFGPPHPRDFPSNGHLPEKMIRFDIISIFFFIMLIALGLATQINRQWQFTEQRASKAEADKTKAELSFLKAQINPHFLFNTLNNIYTLSLMQHADTPASILKLSQIMRYITEDSSDIVPLDKEIECISNYIDLQRLRLGEKTLVNFKAEGNTHEKNIAPLILMTFVENAFKYGTSSHTLSNIIINIYSGEQGIIFFCQNTINKKSPTENLGIGLTNTKRRLEHLYAGKYDINITTDLDLFTVKLTLRV